jgi:Flp pilus assembly protein protease CpaA
MFVPLIHSLIIAIPLAVIDFREKRLPNKLVLPNFAVALIAVFISIVLGEWQRGLVSLGISVLVFVAGLLLSVRGAIGMGDVKLLTALSLSLSWFSAWNIPIVLGVTALAMVVVIAVKFFSKTIRVGSTIALGPYVLSVFVVLAGNTLLSAF